MKTLLLNPPYPSKVIRRYICSHNVYNFLFPPLELMHLASIVKAWKKEEAILIDAIAEGLNLEDVLKRIGTLRPDLLVFMPGFEIFSEDIESIEKIKKIFPDLKIICFGHIPSVFPREILKNTNIDFVVIDEPEISFSELYDRLKYKKSINDLKGIAYKENGDIILNEKRERIKDLDVLPFPDYSLVKVNSYNEPFLDKPFAAIQTARGCPFECNYCVRTFGRMTAYRSAESVIDELKKLKNKFNIATVRFIDDTFTANKERLKRTCQQMLENNLGLNWTCLSRIDALDKETIQLMRKAGCVRIYIGIESGSQKILDFYRKGYRLESIKTQAKIFKDTGIETLGFFMVGAPEETEEDLLKSVNLAKDLDFDYIIVSILTAYPGTQLFNDLKDKIKFSLFPYVNEFKNLNLEKITLWEKKFYRKFYLRPRCVGKKIRIFILKPKELLKDALALWQYIISFQNNKKRNDLL